jgi:hypothetical protein
MTLSHSRKAALFLFLLSLGPLLQFCHAALIEPPPLLEATGEGMRSLWILLAGFFAFWSYCNWRAFVAARALAQLEKSLYVS